MKRFSTPFLVAITIGLFTSCETEIDVTTDWEDVTVVYGLLDPAADTNWIRVERGYLGDQPASASFNETDSLYYDEVAVSLQAIDGNGNQVGSPITLEADYTSRKLEPGPFTTEDYRLYRTTADLNEDYLYRLDVSKPGTDQPSAGATTELVGVSRNSISGFRFQNPRDVFPQIPYFNGNIEWYASDNAEIYEIDVFFYYKEYDRNTGESVNRSFKMDYETLIGTAAEPAGNSVSSNVSLTAFYERIANRIPADDNKLLFFDEMRIEVWAGGEDLATYIQLNEPTSALNQGRPEFPQIENGTGLFSSRTAISLDGIKFSQSFLQKFFMNPQLCDRNFVDINSSGDTCICNQIADRYERLCL